MKKVVAALLCLSMVGSLAACGKKDSDTTKKTKASKDATEVTETPTETELTASEEGNTTTEAETTPVETTESQAETIWELRDIDVVGTFPEHKAEEITGDDNNTLKVASAAICNPKDETIAALKNNDWLSSLGTKADIKGEYGASHIDRVQSMSWYYTYDDGYAIFPADIEASKMYASQIFSVDYFYNTRETIGERSVTVEFNKMDLTDQATQEKVFEIVKLIYGDEFAETLLFAKDPDPDKYAKNPNNCFVHETIDGVNINVTRSLSHDSLRILVSINAEGASKNGGGISGGHTPDFSAFKGLPNKVFGGNTGNQTPNDTALFDTLRAASDFNDKANYMIEYKLLSYRTEDGKEHDSVEIKYDKTIDNSLWFEYDCAFDGDTLVRLTVRHCIMQSVNHGKDNDAHLATLNASLTALLGQEVNIQKSDLDDKGYGKIQINKTYGDKETLFSIEVKDDGQAWWSIVAKPYMS